MVAKDIFSFATVTDGCEEADFMGFSNDYGILYTTSNEFSQKNENLIEKFHKIYLFATVSHGCIGKNILRNHDSWLARSYNW